MSHPAITRRASVAYSRPFSRDDVTRPETTDKEKTARLTRRASVVITRPVSRGDEEVTRPETTDKEKTARLTRRASVVFTRPVSPRPVSRGDEEVTRPETTDKVKTARLTRRASVVLSRPVSRGDEEVTVPETDKEKTARLIHRSARLAKAGQAFLTVPGTPPMGRSTTIGGPLEADRARTAGTPLAERARTPTQRVISRRASIAGLPTATMMKRFSTREISRAPTLEEDENESSPREEVIKPLASPPSAVDLRPMMLARKYRLEPREIKRILKALPSEGSIVEQEDFHTMLCNVFDVPVVKPEIMQSAYTTTGFDESCDSERFLDWYIANMFLDVAALKACPKGHGNNDVAYQLARKHGCSVTAVDKVIKEFTRFDVDSSGEIDYQEFKLMMVNLLKISCASDISAQRLQKFWQEIPKISAGLIDLDGFVEWYLKYFNPDAEDNGADMMGPAEALLASYHPVVQRRKALDSKLEDLMRLGA